MAQRRFRPELSLYQSRGLGELEAAERAVTRKPKKRATRKPRNMARYFGIALSDISSLSVTAIR